MFFPSAARVTDVLPSGLDPGMVIVFAIILGALVLFATEAVPVDVTAIGIMLSLLVVEPVSTMLVEWGVLESAVYVLRAPGSEVTAVERGLSGSPASRRSPCWRCSS